MRACSLLLATLLLGCSAEPSFDERYEAAEKTIREKAGRIDGELEARAKAGDAGSPGRVTADDGGAVPDASRKES